MLTSGGADQGNNITEFVVMKPTSKGHQDLVDAIKASHNQDGSLKDDIVTTAKIADGAVTADTLALSAKDAIGSYSTSEVATPFKWVDGKTIYRKTVSCGALPNATTKTVAHGVSGATAFISITGWTTNGSNYFPLPYAPSGTGNPAAGIIVAVVGANVYLETGMDRTSYTTTYVTIHYTK